VVAGAILLLPLPLLSRQRQGRREMLKASGKTDADIELLETLERIATGLIRFRGAWAMVDRKFLDEIIRGTKLETQMDNLREMGKKEYQESRAGSLSCMSEEIWERFILY
jgi:hypothetical protein